MVKRFWFISALGLVIVFAAIFNYLNSPADHANNAAASAALKQRLDLAQQGQPVGLNLPSEDEIEIDEVVARNIAAAANIPVEAVRRELRARTLQSRIYEQSKAQRKEQPTDIAVTAEAAEVDPIEDGVDPLDVAEMPAQQKSDSVEELAVAAVQPEQETVDDAIEVVEPEVAELASVETEAADPLEAVDPIETAALGSGWLVETSGSLRAADIGRPQDSFVSSLADDAVASPLVAALPDDADLPAADLSGDIEYDEEVQAILAEMAQKAEENLALAATTPDATTQLSSLPVSAVEPGIDVQADVKPEPSLLEDFEPFVRDPNVPAAWEQAAVDFTPSDGPIVTIIIDDLGWSARRTTMVSELSEHLALAMLTDASGAPRQAVQAREAGHEVMIHMSMQASGDVAGEAGELKLGMSEGELRSSVDAAISQIDGVVGVNNHMGSLFTTDKAAMRVVLDQINRNGLVFIDSLTTPNSVAGDVAAELGMPYLRRDVFLDHDRDPEAIKGELQRLEDIAQERGWAIAIGHPYIETIDALAAWIPTLGRKGITLAPLSTMIKLQNQQTQTAQRPVN